jgi:hypothetical protein
MTHQDKARPWGRTVSPEQGRSLLFGILFTILLWANTSLAQNTNKSEILFLHVKLSNQQITLLDKNTRPGVLKRHRDGTGHELHFEVMSNSGQMLWKGATGDPAVREYEYEDPPGSGKMNHKIVPLAEAEFTVRVPVFANAQRVDFYQLEVTAPGAPSEKRLSKKILGSVTLP